MRDDHIDRPAPPLSGPGRGTPRVLVFNEYYWPGVEATAHLLTELCEGLASDYDVTVVTGSLPEARSGRTVAHGVEVIRVPSTAFERTRLSRRALNYLSYVTFAAQKGMLARRPDIVVCMTDPPFLGAAARLIAARHGAPFLAISQDVFPEIAVELKQLENPVVVGILRMLVGYYLRNADGVVAIGERMRERLVRKGVPPERVRIIPNWVDTQAITPVEADNEWARQNELDGRFVVMHSGNVGYAQNLDSLIRAATFLRDLEDLEVVIIGTGARHAYLVELAQRLEADNVRFIPYQPRELLPLSLSGAHVHVIGLARGLSGFVVPSRLYGVLAVARPAIVAADDDSESARLVREVGCGVVVPPGRPDRLAAAIRDAYSGSLDLDEMGRLGREYVVAEADREVALGRYRELIREVISARAG